MFIPRRFDSNKNTPQKSFQPCMLNNILNRLRIKRIVGFFLKHFFSPVFQSGRIVYSGKVLCVFLFLVA